MKQIIECVPNFSEGQRPEVIDAIAQAIRNISQVKLFHIDTGYSANRTVITFAGDPQAVTEAAFQAIKVAAELIDMSTHAGIHPRMGATDVCPLIPVSGIAMEEVDTLANKLAKRVGEELGIPVYLYEHSAKDSKRKNLATIRSGEYEGFREKILQAEWKPDFGLQIFNAKSGQTVIGARDFLIAYNVNLNSKDEKLANQIAREIRESGKRVMVEGKKIRVPGRFKGVKAIGWYIEEFKKAQVSTNVTNMHLSPVHEVFDAISEEAKKLGIEVSGSELIGMAPLKVFVDAGKHAFAKKVIDVENRSEIELVKEAVKYLGLNELTPFEINEKVLEYKLNA